MSREPLTNVVSTSKYGMSLWRLCDYTQLTNPLVFLYNLLLPSCIITVFCIVTNIYPYEFNIPRLGI